MANSETSTSQARSQAAATPLTTMSVLAPVLGWLIPGAGHLIQRRWIRGIVLMVSVLAMFAIGLSIDGKIYKPNTDDLLDILGFVSDMGVGGLYILGRMLNWGSEAITYAGADYGTKFIAVAGLLNIMIVVDAYHIAIRKKP